MNDSIDARICRLEGELAKQRQLARGLLVILFGLFSVGVAIGAAATSQDFDVITAKKLVIKDADGRERIRLEAPKAGPSGDAKVAVLAEDGTEVCVMGQYSGSLGVFYTRRYAGDTPGAYLYSSADFVGVDASGGGGNVPISVTASKSGQAITICNRKDRKPRIDLSVVNDAATVSMVDGAGNTKFLLQEGDPAATATSSAKVDVSGSERVLQVKPK